MLGTFIGGIVLGLAQTLGYHFFGIGYQLFITYLVILVMLVIRPQGILGVKR
jgi:branched-chain amino acid transport system permease protein